MTTTRNTTKHQQSILLQMILDSIPLPISYADASGSFLLFNHALESIYDGKDILGKTVFDLYPSKLAKYHTSKTREALKKMAPVTYMPPKKDPLWGHTITKLPFIGDTGKPEGVITISRSLQSGLVNKTDMDLRLLNQIVNSVNGATLILDNDVILEANESVEKYFQRPRKELVNRSIYELMPENQPDGIESSAGFSNFVATAYENKTNTFQWVFENKDHTPFACTVKLGLAGMTYHKLLILNILDMSMTKKLTTELDQTRKFIGTVAKLNADAFVIYKDKLPVESNELFLNLLDLKNIVELVKKNDMFLFYDGKGNADSLTNHIMALEKPATNVLLRAIKPDNIPLVFSVSADTLDYDGQETTIAILKDISHDKTKEKSLMCEKIIMRDIADYLLEPCIAATIDGKAFFHNASADLFFGYDLGFENAKDMNIFSCFSPGDQVRLRHQIEMVISGKQPGGVSYIARRKDGSEFPVIILLIPAMFENGVAYVRAIIRDMSQLSAEDRSEASYKMLHYCTFENSGAASAIVEKNDLSFVRANRYFMRLAGFDSDRIEDGLNLSDLLDKPTLATIKHTIVHKNTAYAPESFKGVFIRRDGTHKDVIISTSELAHFGRVLVSVTEKVVEYQLSD